MFVAQCSEAGLQIIDRSAAGPPSADFPGERSDLPLELMLAVDQIRACELCLIAPPSEHLNQSLRTYLKDGSAPWRYRTGL